MTQRRFFVTQDGYLVAFLRLRNFRHWLLLDDDGEITYRFIASPDLERAIQEFDTDTDLHEFVTMHQWLKDRTRVKLKEIASNARVKGGL